VLKAYADHYAVFATVQARRLLLRPKGGLSIASRQDLGIEVDEFEITL
jgi:hypothetical protein